jgi:LPS export ABC transporter permease LptG
MRKYSGIFALIFFGLLSVIVIITFFERIDNIYEFGRPLSLLIKFVGYKIPEFIFYLMPVTALSSTLLSLGLLARFNEITAMKTCGISLYRTILPVLVLAALVSLFSFYLQENVLPYANKKASEVWKEITDEPKKTFSRFDRHWVLGNRENRLYSYEYFDPDTAAFNRISIIEIDLSAWRIRERIYAERGYFEGNELLLSDCWTRTFEGNTQVSFNKENEKKLQLEEDKNYFLKEGKTPDQMRFYELRKYIDLVKKSGYNTVKLNVDLHFKISFPFICLIMTLIGIPFAFSMGKRGVLVGFGLSLVMAILYWISVGFFRSLGYVSFLNPFLAAWGPNLVFGLFALYMIFTLKT